MKIALAAVLALGMAFGWSSFDEPLEAAVIAMDVNALTHGSNLVLRAQVVDSSVAWTSDGNMIYSSFALVPVEALKGTAHSTIVVRVPGGELGGIKIRNGEAPDFALGEDVVVFLKAQEDGSYMTYSWFQGKYTVLGGTEIRELNDTNYSTLRDQILAAANG